MKASAEHLRRRRLALSARSLATDCARVCVLTTRTIRFSDSGVGTRTGMDGRGKRFTYQKEVVLSFDIVS